MSGSAAFVQLKAPVRFVATTLDQSSWSIEIARPSARMPALLISARIGPRDTRTRAKAAITASRSPTSPSARPSRATSHPSASRRSAIAAPMPRVPPVTTAQPSSGRDICTLLPGHDPGAPDEPGAERGEPDRRARHELPVALGLPERKRDRGRRRVRHAIDVQRDLLGRKPELGRSRLDDARVGLVSDEEGEVVRGEAGPAERYPHRLDHARDGMAGDLAAPPPRG